MQAKFSNLSDLEVVCAHRSQRSVFNRLFAQQRGHGAANSEKTDLAGADPAETRGFSLSTLRVRQAPGAEQTHQRGTFRAS
jgi:hypothetical protein